ncbi:hypothetical protein [uncultured Shewanella sp.]|nr:hypothetical protein [uncultured Shewanella sp.]
MMLSLRGLPSLYSELCLGSELCLEALSAMYAVIQDWIGGIA